VVDRAGYARLEQATEAHPWAASTLHPYTFAAGGPPTRDNEVTLPAPTAYQLGDQVSVTTSEGLRTFIVSGVVRTAAPQALYVTDATAAELSNGKVAAVALFAAPGTDPATLAVRVRAALTDEPGLRVLTGDERRLAEPDTQAGLLVATASMLGDTAGMAVFVTIFVVAATFAFTVALRRESSHFFAQSVPHLGRSAAWSSVRRWPSARSAELPAAPSPRSSPHHASDG
jgi:putative ABC transport system permease protein